MTIGPMISMLCADKVMTYPGAGYTLSIKRNDGGSPERIMQSTASGAKEWKPASRDLLRGDWESAGA